MMVHTRVEPTQPIDNSDVAYRSERAGRRVMPRAMGVDEYVEHKLDILEHHFYLRLTDAEKLHFKACKTIADVDQYAFDLIKKKL